MKSEDVKKLFAECKTEKAVYATLSKHRITHEDARKRGECNYLNIRIVCNDGTIRIYKPHRGPITIQRLQAFTMRYSGIPTFFATDSTF